MIYSEYPPSHYPVGQKFVDDIERWNWRWTLRGEAPDSTFDEALLQYFNRAQRTIMEQQPLDTLAFLKSHLETLVTPEVVQRLTEAQARLDRPHVARVEGNVVYANFR